LFENVLVLKNNLILAKHKLLKMKPIFTLILFSLFYVGFSQKTENSIDTLYLKSGEVHLGNKNKY